VKIVRISNAGDEVMIERHHAGSLFGNLCFCGGALCREGLEREVAVALEDSRVIITTLDTLKRNIHRCPEKLLALLEDYCRRLAVARTRIESLILQDAEERLARSLLLLTAHQNGGCGSVTLDPPITHEELARWIGVTRPFVTRLMQQLRERGFIETLADGHLLIHRQRIADAYF
jgi:CRP-like cAMP-binding protein